MDDNNLDEQVVNEVADQGDQAEQGQDQTVQQPISAEDQSLLQVDESHSHGSDNRNQLKHRVLQALKPLAPQVEDKIDRGYLLMDILSEHWDDATAKQLFELADNMDDVKEKVRIYQNLLSEIRYREGQDKSNN